MQESTFIPRTHRVLLAAYPARLRRRHGAELITTMTEMTAGQPSRADRFRLVADGLRERFRLPVRRPLGAVTALLALLIGGAIGTAAGSWAGEQTDQWGFRARSGGLQVSVWGYPEPGHPVEVIGSPIRPATYLPLVLGGLLLGLLAGWLVGAALVYRLAAAHHRAPAAVTAALSAATLAVPSAKLYQNLFTFLRTDDGVGAGALVHHALAWMPWPLRDPTQFPDSTAPGLRTLLAGLVLVALAAAAARRPPASET